MKIYITREIAEVGIQYLKKKKYDVSVYSKDNPISRNGLIRNIRDADAVVCLLTEKFDKELIDQIKKCKIIANVAVGYNNIDVEYAREKNIIVTNTPDVLTQSTADLTMALTLACARRLIEGEELIRKKKFKGWKPKLLLGVELKDKVFGILGAGRIGTAVALRAKAFGTRIVYFSKLRNYELEKKTDAKKLTLDSILKGSDIISIHLPLNKETFHLLNKEKLKLLKKSCIMINTARGEIVDEKELISLLKNNKILSAGFDVYENEPHINSELLKLKNVVLLPHIGSATDDARNNMALLAVRNVDAVLSGKKPLTPVN